MKRFLALWLPVVVWMGVIFAGSSIGKVPQVGGETLDGLVHRAAHVLEFAVLGALLLRATSKGKPVSKREIIIALLLVGLYGASDEFHQRFTPGRNSEGISVLFDVAGGALGMWAWHRWSRRAQPREVTE
jgi:VanZ family protein